MRDDGSLTNPRDIACRFQCRMSGNCCRGDGFVALTDEDIYRIAELLNQTPEEMLDQYAKFDRQSHTWILLDQHDELQSCVFLQNDNTCQIHEAKPEQCQGFPFKWRPQNIDEFCEGWRAAMGLEAAEKRTMSED